MDLFHVGGFTRRSLAVEGVVSDDKQCSVVVENERKEGELRGGEKGL
jgi:hypothetical protein